MSVNKTNPCLVVAVDIVPGRSYNNRKGPGGLYVLKETVSKTVSQNRKSKVVCILDPRITTPFLYMIAGLR